MKNKILSMLGREVNLSYKSDVVLSGGKKNEHQGRITKVSKLKALLIGDGKTYTELKQIEDPYFLPKPRPWGVRIENGLIEHKENLYVEFIVKEYLGSTYFLDGEIVNKLEIIGLKESKVSDIDIRCVNINNILTIG